MGTGHSQPEYVFKYTVQHDSQKWDLSGVDRGSEVGLNGLCRAVSLPTLGQVVEETERRIVAALGWKRAPKYVPYGRGVGWRNSQLIAVLRNV